MYPTAYSFRTPGRSFRTSGRVIAVIATTEA
jgi:hypothetical protein